MTSSSAIGVKAFERAAMPSPKTRPIRATTTTPATTTAAVAFPAASTSSSSCSLFSSSSSSSSSSRTLSSSRAASSRRSCVVVSRNGTRRNRNNNNNRGGLLVVSFSAPAKQQQQQQQHADLSPLYSGPPLSPVASSVSAFAPATVANLGPGFDWLGAAVGGAGDTVVARPLPGEPGRIVIDGIEGDGGRLSLKAEENCAGIAAAATLKLLGSPQSAGVALTLKKGLPLGSGLGSSAASAAAAAAAVNGLFGSPLSNEQLVPAGLESEAAVSGFHADNIAPALMGGFVLIRSAEPLDVRQLSFGGGGSSGGATATATTAATGNKENIAPLFFALVNPVFEAPTAEMRAVLPASVPMKSAVSNCAAGGALVAAILQGDAARLGEALGADALVEPVRGPLIPGFAAVKKAAAEAGALGCTISGAGPTCVAVVRDEASGLRVAEAMCRAFKEIGKLEIGSSRVAALDSLGARVVEVVE